MSIIDKTPLKSKKFIFALFSLLILAIITIVIAVMQTITWPVAATLVILSIGLIVIPVGYVLGQAAIDKVAAMINSVSGMVGGQNDRNSEE